MEWAALGCSEAKRLIVREVIRIIPELDVTLDKMTSMLPSLRFYIWYKMLHFKLGKRQ